MFLSVPLFVKPQVLLNLENKNENQFHERLKCTSRFSSSNKTNKIARGCGASAICGLWKNLQVLIYSKLHEKNYVITY